MKDFFTRRNVFIKAMRNGWRLHAKVRRITPDDCPPNARPSTNYDIFHDSPAVAWLDDLARADNLYWDWLNRPRSTKTHAFYLGTLRTTSDGKPIDTYEHRYVWNFYGSKVAK